MNKPLQDKPPNQIYLAVEGEDDTKCSPEELDELGLEADTSHIKIDFDSDATYKYSACLTCILLLIGCFPLLLLIPCLLYGIKASIDSRKAAVTTKTLSYKSGAYGCCCCCWNQQTKSVPLNKITDLSISQGCLQRFFGVNDIRVETASSNNAMPELVLIGVKNANQTRKKILRIRDNATDGDDINIFNKNKNSNNSNNNNGKLLLIGNDNNNNNNNNYNNNNANIEKLMQQQTQTLMEMKDLLVDMRNALTNNNNNNNNNK